jgi:hypothetical protein
MPLPLARLQLLAVIKKDSTILNPSIQVNNAAIRACAEALDLPRACYSWIRSGKKASSNGDHLRIARDGL